MCITVKFNVLFVVLRLALEFVQQPDKQVMQLKRLRSNDQLATAER